jgi:hypothetical protein
VYPDASTIFKECRRERFIRRLTRSTVHGANASERARIGVIGCDNQGGNHIKSRSLLMSRKESASEQI